MPGTRNICHAITTRDNTKTQMTKTLFTRHCNTVEPMMLVNDRKATFQALHADAVNMPGKSHEINVVLDDSPLPINNSKKDLSRKERTTLAQLRSSYCGFQPDNTSTVRFMEQSGGLYPGTQLSRGKRLRLKWTYIERQHSTKERVE